MERTQPQGTPLVSDKLNPLDKRLIYLPQGDSGDFHCARLPPVQEHLPPGMYSYDSRNGGMAFFRKELADVAMVSLSTEQDVMLADFQTFWNDAAAYANIGVPHRRGWLFHGPAGTGKTTLVRMMARDIINSGGIVLQLSIINELESAIKFLQESKPLVRIMVLCEDIDSILALDGEAKPRETQLTHMLDGLSGQEHVAFVITTNFFSKIPKRLRRPGRFDDVRYIGYASEESRRRYFEAMTQKHPVPASLLARLVACSWGLPMSHIREVFMRTVVFGKVPEDVSTELREDVGAEETPAKSAKPGGPARMINPFVESLASATDSIMQFAMPTISGEAKGGTVSSNGLAH